MNRILNNSNYYGFSYIYNKLNLLNLIAWGEVKREALKMVKAEVKRDDLQPITFHFIDHSNMIINTDLKAFE